MPKSNICKIAAGLVMALPIIGRAADIQTSDHAALAALAGRIEAVADYTAYADFEVWLPSAADPVTYQLELRQAKAQVADTLMDCNYLIEWTLDTPSGETTGFLSYFDGNHFRFGNNKLLEYHADTGPGLFAPDGNTGAGVHRRAQFVDLLPASIAAELRLMASDPGYTCTITERDNHIAVAGSYEVNGETARIFKYVFNAANALPEQLDIDTSPDLISEQNIVVKYHDSSLKSTPANEQALIEMYPDVFAKFRRSSFRLESLLDQPVPEFAITTLGGDRYIHHRGGHFDAPTLIAFLDTAVGNPAEAVAALRQVVDQFPGNMQLILAFDDNRAEEIEALVGPVRADEVILTGARGMARDFGVVDRPTVVLCDRDGFIRHFVIGMNKNRVDEVLQQSTLL